MPTQHQQTASRLLHERLAADVAQWRSSGYQFADHPLIGEILAYQKEGQEENPSLTYLREPQFLALEVYWYVRLVLNTPHTIDLYMRLYGNDTRALLDALGVSMSRDALPHLKIDDLIRMIKEDEGFVAEKRIQALHEAAVLDYPSYILALAMGAGKTVLIGAIAATEFAMSLRYPEGNFMKNALIFAPGTTIIESLRELADVPYERILPPDLNRDFLANLKMEFLSSEKDIQAQSGSAYNLIVTNTEKISLRANRRRKQQVTFERSEVQANLRLQKIASLPNLGIFSDEAHHTYGNTFNELKRVRETIDYIHEKTPVVAVINTTGTPYYNKQHLKEVLVWYGLGEGIKDNILKSLKNGIHLYNIGEQPDEEVFGDIIREFFGTYGEVALPDGSKAKIAFYFKTQEHLNQSRLAIERAMTAINQSVSQILVNTQTSAASEIDQFKQLNNPANQKRVILLIGKGVEGWNCPSLFACALIKEQTSHTYVLQASTRCLRQVKGNTHSAKIFLDSQNAKVLNKELQSNFGTDLATLSKDEGEKEPVTLRILKTELPKLEITRTIKRAVRAEEPDGKITLERAEVGDPPPILLSILTPEFKHPREMLMPTGETRELPPASKNISRQAAAWEIASRYHLPIMPILERLKRLYPEGDMQKSNLYGLMQQVETQQANYRTIEEKITEAMALIKTHDEAGREIFEMDEDGTYIHRLRLLKRTLERMNAGGLLAYIGDSTGGYEDKHDLTFHYTPYNFDSKSERSLFEGVLSILNTDPKEVEAFLFVGGITDTKKTDFHFEYRGVDKRYHPYFPDFVIIKKTGEFYIVEIKSDDRRDDPNVEAKKKAVEKIQRMQPNKFKYKVIYTVADMVVPEEFAAIKNWVKERN